MSLVSFRITDSPDQQFSATLGGKRVVMRIRYNPSINRWSLNLGIDKDMVLHGRRIVTGCDLLDAFDFGIGVLFAGTDKPGGEDLPPGREELVGGTVKLFHALQEDVDEAILQIEEASDATAVSP
jgi:hypothetical protein